MTESVYLSADQQWDIEDVLLGTLPAELSLDVQVEEGRQLIADLTGIAIGDYYVIVRTDLLNNIHESVEENNQAFSTFPMRVDVKELLLDSLTNTILYHQEALYYRIEIPEGLGGESLLVSLDGDDQNGINELYLRYGDIPTRSVHDLAFDTYAGDQQIVVPELRPGTYYLLAYGSSMPIEAQPVSLLAEILHFEIIQVDASRGGNTGPVTVKIRGAKMDEGTIFQLDNGQGQTIIGSNLVRVDPSLAFVTFDLAGSPVGHYDVRGTNGVGDSTELTDGFEVVTGTTPSLSTNLKIPSHTREWHPFKTFEVEFANESNIDILNPILHLQSLAGAPMSLTLEGLESGSVEIELIPGETNGPAGVLRPGAGGIIKVFTKPTAALVFMLEVK